MGTDAKQGAASLAQALRAPLENGDLDGALAAARRAQLRNPADDDRRRIVEALELLISQVWYGGQEGSEPTEDSPFARAAQALERGDLAAALAEYQGTDARGRDPQRARRLAHRAQVVIAAATGDALPPREASAPMSVEAPAVSTDPHQAPTRVGGPDRPRPDPPRPDPPRPDQPGPPIEALVADEVVDEPAHPTITEVTEPLELGDYDLFEETSRETKAGLRETTRVAKDGELPLAELRRQIAREESGAAAIGDAPVSRQPSPDDSDTALDGLLEELEEESAELEIEVDVDLDDGLGRPAPSTPSKTFRRPSVEELERADDVLTPPPYRSDPPPPPPPRRPSSPPIPPKDQLSADPIHAPLDTGEVAMPEHRVAPAEEPTRSGVLDEDPTTSWSGVPIYEAEPATFEPGEITVEHDRWDVPTNVKSLGKEREAEALVARGELEKALKLYEVLAAQSPEETRLWRRIKAIAWMLQRDSDPTEI